MSNLLGLKARYSNWKNIEISIFGWGDGRLGFANLPKFSCMYSCHVPQGGFSLVSIWEVWKPGYIYYYNQGTQRLLVKKLPNAQLPQNCYKSSNSFFKISFKSLWNFSNQSVWHSNFNKSPTPAEVDDFFLVIVWGSIYNKIVEETHKRTTLIDCCEGCHTAIYWSRL